MKPFLIWSALTVVVFGGLSGAYHGYATTHPHKIVVVVDSSFPMQSVWNRVPAELERLTGQRYSSYSLFTEKNRIHGWASTLQLGTVMTYAPRDFSKLINGTDFTEIQEATQKYLITNATAAETNTLKDWTIVRVAP